jgi:hypothetical protein
MTGDALFGPDGTQLPAPPPVLFDPPVSPGAFDQNGQVSAGAPFDAAAPGVNAVPAAVPLPPGIDLSAMREAIRAALGDEPTARQLPVESPPRPAPEPPFESLLTPPSGIPVQLGRPPPSGIPVQPGQPPVPLSDPSIQSGQPPPPVPPPGAGQSPFPPPAAPMPTPPAAHSVQPGQPGQPVQRPGPSPARWPTDRPARAHLDQARRNPSGGGWIGCIVLLIFIVIVTFNIVSALIDAITGG